MSVTLEKQSVETIDVETVEVTKPEFVTAYQLNRMLTDAGRVRRPQQMYRYVKQDLIPSQIVNGQTVVAYEDAVLFVEWFCAKHTD